MPGKPTFSVDFSDNNYYLTDMDLQISGGGADSNSSLSISFNKYY